VKTRFSFSAAVFLAWAISSAQADTLVQWNFNSPTPDANTSTGTTAPSVGAGTASTLGGVTNTFSTGSGADPAPSADNSGWNISKFPGATSNNLSAGVRFDASTAGYTNIQVSWSQRNSATASRYLRLQYTADGMHFTNATATAVLADSVFTNQAVDLSGIAACANNPNFGIRLVTEFESTATGSGTNAYVATDSASSYGTSGTMRFDLVTIAGTFIPDGNTPPYIFSNISNQTVRPYQSTGPLPFTVLDAESPASALTLAGVSSDPAVVYPGDIVFGGSGANRTVAVTASGQAGTAQVTVFVRDPGGKSNSMSFAVTVLAANTAPFISAISRTNTLANTSVPGIAFTVWDLESAAGELTVSGTSANAALVPNDPAHVSFGGSGSNRTLTLTPAGDQIGVAPITVTVSDGTNTSSTVFGLMVTPSTNVLFYDPFSYADGSLLTNSGFYWANRSGTDGECQVVSGQARLSDAGTEDLVGPLIAGPYDTGKQTVLYAACKLTCVTLPNAAPGLIAHFANGSTLRGRLYAGTTNAAPNGFRLHVANGSTTAVPILVDLATNVAYAIVTRYKIDENSTTVWINPAAESDFSVTAADVQSPNRIASYGFRQDADIGGTFLLDDLRVGRTFEAALGTGGGSPLPIPLEYEYVGGSLVLRWSNPAFALQSAPAANGPYTNLPAATSPHTNPISGVERFFRLKAN
jgi:hypothetical protein